jgi:hypothetical protein
MSKSQKFIIPILVATPLLLLLAQCSYGDLRPILIGKKIWLEDDNAPLEQAIRGLIPVGSSITEARNILELNGYVCENPKEAEPGELSKITEIRENANYLLFCQVEGSRFICVRTNKSFVYYKHQTVTKIDAGIGGWCL